MFEKEAEEYACEYARQYLHNDGSGLTNSYCETYNGYYRGANDGYNKAKEELENKNAELKVRLNAINLLTPELKKSSKLKSQRLTYAKTIIKDLLDNSDEYARQRAEDFLKESEE